MLPQGVCNLNCDDTGRKSEFSFFGFHLTEVVHHHPVAVIVLGWSLIPIPYSGISNNNTFYSKDMKY